MNMDPIQNHPTITDSTERETRPKLRNALVEKMSAIWKTVAEWFKIPSSLRTFSAHVQEQWDEITKRIGYALQRLWPNFLIKTHSSSEQAMFYILKRVVEGRKESLGTVDAFQVGEQVKRDIPRTRWPLFYERGGASTECPNSKDETETDTKSAKILNWLQTQLLQEPKIPKDETSQKQAIINLTSLLFHQSLSADKVVDLMKQWNSSIHNYPITVKNAESDIFYHEALIRSTKNGLTIKLTWVFDVVSANPDNPSRLGRQQFSRTISIPWEELVADWQNSPPPKSKLTVQDKTPAFLPSTT